MKFPIRNLSIHAVALAGAIAMATVTGSQQPAWADSSMSIDVLGQQEAAWAGAALGTSPTETVASAGCAITSVTMMLQYYGLSTDPGAFNSWLTANGGYAFDDQLIWDAVTTYTGGRVAFSGWLGPDMGVIHAELDAERPVVAEVYLYNNQHFVLITGYTSDGGLIINDPWFGDTVNFNARYGDAATEIVSIRTFMPRDPASARGRSSWIANAIAAAHLER